MTDPISVWTSDLSSYALLDSGNGQKLERINGTVVARSEPRAWWNPERPASEWVEASASYAREDKSGWMFSRDIPHEFPIEIGVLTAEIRLSGFSKHIGIFPEQSEQWSWIAQKIAARREKGEVSMLNLFGYTGLATLAAAQSGARVTHVDGSNQTIDWARRNQALSHLGDAPIRWILDDCLRFVKKEARQGKKYDAIIMDPPSFGRGPKGQVWKVEERLGELLSECRTLLSADPLFVILNMYSIDLSSLSLANLVSDMMAGYGGRIERGELALKHEHSDRLLPLSLSVRWSR